MTKEISLQVTGMTCAACSARIEKGLNRMEGVESATVNLAIEKAAIPASSPYNFRGQYINRSLSPHNIA